MEQADTIDELFRNRWRTLVSVDDAIAAMVQTITDLDLIDSTYFFSTSDHGYVHACTHVCICMYLYLSLFESSMIQCH